jgi:hypothetical protein
LDMGFFLLSSASCTLASLFCFFFLMRGAIFLCNGLPMLTDGIDGCQDLPSLFWPGRFLPPCPNLDMFLQVVRVLPLRTRLSLALDSIAAHVLRTAQDCLLCIHINWGAWTFAGSLSSWYHPPGYHEVALSVSGQFSFSLLCFSHGGSEVIYIKNCSRQRHSQEQTHILLQSQYGLFLTCRKNEHTECQTWRCNYYLYYLLL